MCTFLNDYRQGLEINYIPRQAIQTFFGNTARIPEPGDLIASYGSEISYEILRVQQLAGKTYIGQCQERKLE